MKQKIIRQSARELGVSASYLSQVENGKRRVSQKLLCNSACATLLSTSAKQNVYTSGCSAVR